jgi:hypothetical protein
VHQNVTKFTQIQKEKKTFLKNLMKLSKTYREIPQGSWLFGTYPIWYHKGPKFKPAGGQVKALLCPFPLGPNLSYFQ